MSGFDALAKKYENYAKAPNTTATHATRDIEKAIDDEFAQGRSPDGIPWKPLKKGGASKLQETGAMRNSLSVTADGTDINISFSDAKVGFHQSTRPVLSTGNIPKTWSDAVEKSFSEAIKNTK